MPAASRELIACLQRASDNAVQIPCNQAHLFFLLAFVFFLFLLFDLEHETDSVDQSDQEGKDKSAAENVTD